MTAKKPEAEKVARTEIRARQSRGQKRALARKRAAEVTYTDAVTGKHYIGGFEVSEETWQAFAAEHPELHLVEPEVVEGEVVEEVEVSLPPAPVRPDAMEPEDDPLMREFEPWDPAGDEPDPNIDGSQAARHLHRDLGSSGVWHTHVNGGIPHGHPADYAGEIPPPAALKVLPEKTDEEKDAEHAEALKAAQEADREAKVAIPKIGDEDADLVFHVLEDGFTVIGKVWYRGEEIHIKKGSRLWDLTLDRNGKSWTDMGENEQMLRYDKVMFRSGPWPFVQREMTEDDYDRALTENDQEAVRRYEKTMQRRGVPAPVAGATKAGERKW